MCQVSDADIAVMKNDISQIKDDMGEIKDALKRLPENYVSRNEFQPVKLIVYGIVAISLSFILGKLLNLI